MLKTSTDRPHPSNGEPPDPKDGTEMDSHWHKMSMKTPTEHMGTAFIQNLKVLNTTWDEAEQLAHMLPSMGGSKSKSSYITISH